MNWTALTLDRSKAGGLYVQLRESLRQSITSGALKPGDRLPSERELAVTLGVSRTTVVTAYQELESQGLVRGHVGRGTFVCAVDRAEPGGDAFPWHGKVALGSLRSIDTNLRSIVRNSSDTSIISFAAGVSALECFPVARFAELTSQMLNERPVDALSLAPTEGHPALRAALADRQQVSASRMMAVAGAQQGIDLATRLLVDPGDAVIMDRPGYLGAIPVFRAAGANIVGWDSMRGGVDELEDLILRFRPKFLYVTPTHRNPTGQTWGARFRRDLLELVGRYRLPVIEDDPYSDLWFESPPPRSLSALANGHGVIYIGSFAKSLSGALRLGWICAEEAMINHLSLIKQRSDVCSPSLSQLTVAALITSGDFERHLVRLRPELARRRREMAIAIEREWPAGVARVNDVTGGIFLWVDLGDLIDAQSLLVEANRLGVSFVPGGAFYPGSEGRGELRLCYSSQPPAAIQEGIRRMGIALRAELARLREGVLSEPLV
jgi:2-aminoadipate transaminase